MIQRRLSVVGAIAIILGTTVPVMADPESTCAGFAKQLSAEHSKEVPADTEELRRAGFPDCLTASVCFAFQKDSRYHVDVGVLVTNSCNADVYVRVFLPKKVKGTSDPDAASVASKDPKAKSATGGPIAKGHSYMFGTISPYSKEIPVESIMLELRR